MLQPIAGVSGSSLGLTSSNPFRAEAADPRSYGCFWSDCGFVSSRKGRCMSKCRAAPFAMRKEQCEFRWPSRNQEEKALAEFGISDISKLKPRDW